MKSIGIVIVVLCLLGSSAAAAEKRPLDGSKMHLSVRVMEHYEGRPGKPAGPRPVGGTSVPLNALNSEMMFDGKTVALTWELLDDQTAKIFVTSGECKDSFKPCAIHECGLSQHRVNVVGAAVETMKFGDTMKLAWPHRQGTRDTWVELTLGPRQDDE
jgi:hypothetical protein